MANGSGLSLLISNSNKQLLLSKVTFYNTVAEMMESTKLKSGICDTLGFASKNDGGGARYSITTGLTADNITIFAIANGKFAQLIVDAGKTYDLRCFGCFPNSGVSESIRITAAVLKASTAKAILSQTSGTYLIGSRLTLKPIEIIGNLFAPPEWSIMNTFSSFNTDDDIITFSGTNAATDKVVLRNILITLATTSGSAFQTYGLECTLMKLKYAQRVILDNTVINITSDGYSTPITNVDLRDCNNIDIINSKISNLSAHNTGGCLWIRGILNASVSNINVINSELTHGGQDELIAFWSNTSGNTTFSNILFDNVRLNRVLTAVGTTSFVAMYQCALLENVTFRNVKTYIDYTCTTVFNFDNAKTRNVVFDNSYVYISATGNVSQIYGAKTMVASIASTEESNADIIHIDGGGVVSLTNIKSYFSCRGAHIIADNVVFNANITEGIVDMFMGNVAHTFYYNFADFNNCRFYCTATSGNYAHTIVQGHGKVEYNSCYMQVSPKTYMDTNAIKFDVSFFNCTVKSLAWFPFLQETSGYVAGEVNLKVANCRVSGSCSAEYGTIGLLTSALYADNFFFDRTRADFGVSTSLTAIKKRNTFSDGYEDGYPIQYLLSVSSAAPATSAKGDYYFDTDTNKLYIATGTNTWGTIEYVPKYITIYLAGTTRTPYVWNGTTLITI